MKKTDFHPIRRGIPGRHSLTRWPLAAVLAALVLALAFSPSVAGDPHSAFYSTDNDKIFWFIHASDIHVGARVSTDTANLQWLVTTAKSTINPSFIVVTGDLTDSTNGNLLGYPDGPYQAEWDQYKSIVDPNVTPDKYFDLPGNHDAYSDQYFAYYRANSVQGRATGLTQHSWTRVFPFGTYHFLGVNTADNTGDGFSLFWPYGDYAGLDTAELYFINSQLSANRAANLTLVFGHHPLAATGDSTDTYLYYGKDEFVGSLNTYGASLYGYGHTHATVESFYSTNMTEGVFYFNVSSLGKDSPNQFTVTAIDCNGIASVTQSVKTWPVVLITAPMDKTLGKNVNPYTYTVTNSAANPIRALVFDPGTVSLVQYRIDTAGSWYPMARAASSYPHLWEGTWNASALASGEHTIEVQATTASGVRTDTVKVNVQATVPQPQAKVATLATGKYVKRTTNLSPAITFVPGDSIVFRATVTNSSGAPLPNATVRISVAGPQTMTVLTGPSDANGIADGIWKTSAPSKKSTGTTTGDYRGTVSGVTASGYVWDGTATAVTFTIQK
ncbi:MAG: metallophosphoesterase [Desulfobacterales bacterium]|nr:metallophosphoesterase [Desulfobacterales bacterium]